MTARSAARPAERRRALARPQYVLGPSLMRLEPVHTPGPP